MANQPIDISVRAKDEASAALQRIASNVQNLNRGMIGAAGLVGGFIAARASMRAFVDLSEKAAHAYNVQEKAARTLSDAHQAFAAKLQQTLNVGDEVTLGVMRQAQLLGVSEDKLQDVAKASVGLSEITGQGLSESLKKVHQAISGNADALAEYIPELKSLVGEEAKLAYIAEVATKGLQQKSAAAGELEGAMARSANSVGDLYEKIGELLAPALTVVHNAMALAAETAQAALKPAIEAVSAATEFFAGVMRKVIPIVVGGVTAIEVAFTEMRDVGELALTGFYLAVLSTANSIDHILTHVLPTLARWFADNWVSIFSDMANATMTLLGNLGHNIGETVFAIFDWISNGFSGGMAGLGDRLSQALFVGLMDGFEAQTESLPQILDRQISNDEELLLQRMAELGGNVGDAFKNKFAERMAGINGMIGDVDTQVNLSSGKAGSAESATMKAVEGRLLTRGKGDDVPTKTLQTLEKMEKNVAKLAKAEEDKAFRNRTSDSQKLEVELVD